MMIFVEKIIRGVEILYLIYLLIYVSYIFLAVPIGAWQLYQRNRIEMFCEDLRRDYYIPVSIIIAAYNEEVTIVATIKSILKLNYQLYEIIIVDDGSKDDTAKKVIKAFGLKPVNRPINLYLKCKQHKQVYETMYGNIKITLISKINGGKGDSLNMGINVAQFPYFLVIDADSILQKDSLEKMMWSVLEDESVIAVGGLIRISQCLEHKGGKVRQYCLPKNWLTCMQVIEYDRSFLASKILMDQFNGNIIISGAFGLFKKDIVIAAGGYYSKTLGEDMELVLKLHVFCRNNNRKYSVRYEPNAVCWTQVPTSLSDLVKQRRRWHLGLFQCLTNYYWVFANFRYGLISFVSYMYFLFFELLSPVIEVGGLFVVLLSLIFGMLNVTFMVKFILLYSLFGVIISLTAFFQTIYAQNLKISFTVVIRAVLMSLLESLFFRYFLSFVRVTAFIGYRKRKMQWGVIKRIKHNDSQHNM